MHYGKAGGEGEIHVWGGIVSGRVAHLAGALETTPGALLDAVDAAGVTPMVDTAKQNGRKDRDRPTDPEKRCLAFTT